MISAIVLTPTAEGLESDVQGDLAGILAIASNGKSPRPDGQGLSQLKVVAGTRFHLNLRSQPSAIGALFHDAMPSSDLFPGLFATPA